MASSEAMVLEWGRQQARLRCVLQWLAMEDVLHAGETRKIQQLINPLLRSVAAQRNAIAGNAFHNVFDTRNASLLAYSGHIAPLIESETSLCCGAV